VFLADALDDAGLLAPDVAMPSVGVVRPHTSHLFYLRVNDPELSYAAKLKVLRIEAALNAALLASTFFDDADDVPAGELVRFRQRIAASVTSQIPTIADGLAHARGGASQRRVGGAQGHLDGHRALPGALSPPGELPHKRGRRQRGPIVVDLTPPSVMPAHVWVDGMGIVPATPEMRRRAATDYNLRIGILLAACAFRCSSLIQHVWVAGTIDTPSRTTATTQCALTARASRRFPSREPLIPWQPIETLIPRSMRRTASFRP
jgi:hypothetical protein